MTIDRRSTIRLLAAAAATAAASEAQPAPQAQPTVEQALQSARQDLRDAAQRIARVNVPRAVEPSFSFRA